MNVSNYYNSYLFGLNSNLFSSSSALSQKGNNNSSNSNNILDAYNASNTSTVNYSALTYIQNIKSGASSLKSAISTLSGGAAFRQQTAVSSDPESLTVNSTGKAYYNSKTADTTVKIDQVASGQVNEGTALKASEKTGQTGYQQFAIETNGKTYQFSVEVSAKDTNQDLQKKIADAINKKDIGITASVATDTKNGTSTLTVQAKNTGDSDKNRFTIRDVSGSAIAQTGVANMTQDAQDAIYSVNGGANKTSKTNTVDLGNGLNVTLKKASETEVKISAGVNANYAANQATEFVNSYNQLYTATLSNSNDPKSNRLFSQMVGISKTYKASLDKIGINFDQDGFMTINSDKLNKAAQDGSLDRFFNSTGNYGFSSRMSRLADNVTYNTANYVSKSSFINDNYAFMNSPAYNSYYSGMLFDSWF